MQKKRIAAVLALAIAVTGSSTGFMSPATSQVLAPAATTSWAMPGLLEPMGSAPLGIAAKKVNLKKATTNNLNLRKSRSAKAKVLLVIPKNAALTVTETIGTWSKTKYKGKTGWVASRYLKNAPAAKKAAPPKAQPQAKATPSAQKITKNNLNLRQGKSTKTKALVTIPKNTTITVTATSGTWSKTKYKGKTGWVASSYLKNAPAAKKPAPKPQAATHRYTTGFTTLRQGASKTSASLGVYQRRAKVEFLSASGAWSKVKVSGKTGYIESAHLSKTNPAIVHRWLKSTQAVYAGTNNKSAKVTSVKKGAKVEWLRTSGGWTGIRTGGGNGWVPTSTLSTSTIGPTTAKPPAPKATYRWTTATVNIRKGSGTSHKSLGKVPANERVTYLKTANGWSNVVSSKGTGWISNQYLDKEGQHSFAVYGTLRKGQSAYYILKGKTSKETKTTIASHRMYLQPNKTWLSYVIPSKSAADKVVVERMEIKPASYRATVVNMDKWERFNPNKPLADQNYNRVLVTDRDGHRSWAYLGSKKIGAYLTKNGIRVTSGDYLKRF
ncbi:hypothetical protein BLJ79_13975 [Arthrobacter sp. UCD-GKA]|uniref:SH3 domain-containing protein n=1 Tax=Arthrobacter sp. UCD-GKA TaxID=1913576 RepID=UPI0008DDAEEA|nr:SH3 domain-containing protein [Arthrobacter sp. UCD-GKA]OIH83807.1 hypothetical protein BLJ79_13975 [Arthrobacter sp. UCD-GKA]